MLGVLMLMMGSHRVVEIVVVDGAVLAGEMTAGVRVAIVIKHRVAAWVHAHHTVLITWIKSPSCCMFRIVVGRREERGSRRQAAAWRIHGLKWMN